MCFVTESACPVATCVVGSVLLKSYPLLYVTTWEGERVQCCLQEIAQSRKKQLYVWAITQGLVKVGSNETKSKGANTTDA